MHFTYKKKLRRDIIYKRNNFEAKKKRFGTTGQSRWTTGRQQHINILEHIKNVMAIYEAQI